MVFKLLDLIIFLLYLQPKFLPDIVPFEPIDSALCPEHQGFVTVQLQSGMLSASSFCTFFLTSGQYS